MRRGHFCKVLMKYEVVFISFISKHKNNETCIFFSKMKVWVGLNMGENNLKDFSEQQQNLNRDN